MRMAGNASGAGRRRSMGSWPIYWVSVRCVRSAVEASRAASAGRGSALASHGTSHVYATDRKDSSARARVRRENGDTFFRFFFKMEEKCTVISLPSTHTTRLTSAVARASDPQSIGSSSARHARVTADRTRPHAMRSMDPLRTARQAAAKTSLDHIRRSFIYTHIAQCHAHAAECQPGPSAQTRVARRAITSSCNIEHAPWPNGAPDVRRRDTRVRSPCGTHTHTHTHTPRL